MTDNDTRNLDQKQAEELVLKAQTLEEWKAAMNLHFNAVRNMQMTEIVPSFQHGVEVILEKKITALAEQFASIRRDDRARWHETDARLTALADGQNEIEAKQDAIAAALVEVRGGMGKTQSDIEALSARVEARETLDDERYEESREIHQKSMNHRKQLDNAVKALEHELEGVKQELHRLIASRQ